MVQIQHGMEAGKNQLHKSKGQDKNWGKPS